MTRIELPKRDENSPRYKLLPEGSYRVRIWSAVEKMSSKGKPMVEVQYKIDDIGFEAWKRIYDFFSLQENALWKLSNLFDALGLQAEGNVEMNWQDDLVGRALIVIVVHEKRTQGPRTGELCERVESYRSIEEQEADLNIGQSTASTAEEDEVPF